MGVLRKALQPITGSGIFWPQDWTAGSTNLGRSLTGVSVNASSAYGLTTFYAGVRAISEDLAKLPLIVYEDLKPRGKRRAEEHPAYRVLHDRANPAMSAFTWRETSIAHLVSWGNCYSEIVRNDMGELMELWPLPPDRVRVLRDPDTGAKFYRVSLRTPDKQGRYTVDLDAKDVFHVPGLGYDGYVGYNPIDIMAKAIGVGLAAQEFAERFWANNARPGGYLKVPADLQLGDKGKRRLKREFGAAHAGLSNAQRFALLEDGITFEEIGIPPETAQFIESRKFQSTEIARGLRIQPHKVMDLERATFSNIEQQNLEYTTDTLGGWAGRFEAQCRIDLMEPPFYAEHLFDALLRGDTLTRWQSYAIARNLGSLTPNLINEREGLPLREDNGGDEYLRPLNMAVEGPTTNADGSTKPGAITMTAAPEPLSLADQVDAATALIRAGFEPEAALVAVGLPTIDHTGLVPVTVKPLDTITPVETALDLPVTEDAAQ